MSPFTRIGRICRLEFTHRRSGIQRVFWVQQGGLDRVREFPGSRTRTDDQDVSKMGRLDESGGGEVTACLVRQTIRSYSKPGNKILAEDWMN